MPRKEKLNVSKGGNTTLAMAVETRDRWNAYIDKYNEGKPMSERINAKDLATLFIDMAERSNVDLRADLMPLRANPIPEPKINTTELEQRITANVMGAIGQALAPMLSASQYLLEDKERKENRRKRLSEQAKKNVVEDMPLETQIMGRVLASMREMNGLSKADVTSQTGLSNKVINTLEDGTGKPYLQSFLRYASMFDITQIINEYLKQIQK